MHDEAHVYRITNNWLQYATPSIEIVCKGSVWLWIHYDCAIPFAIVYHGGKRNRGKNTLVEFLLGISTLYLSNLVTQIFFFFNFHFKNQHRSHLNVRCMPIIRRHFVIIHFCLLATLSKINQKLRRQCPIFVFWLHTFDPNRINWWSSFTKVFSSRPDLVLHNLAHADFAYERISLKISTRNHSIGKKIGTFVKYDHQFMR